MITFIDWFVDWFVSLLIDQYTNTLGDQYIALHVLN